MARRIVFEGDLELENGSIRVVGFDRRVFLYAALQHWTGYGTEQPWVRITVEELPEEARC